MTEIAVQTMAVEQTNSNADQREVFDLLMVNSELEDCLKEATKIQSRKVRELFGKLSSELINKDRIIAGLESKVEILTTTLEKVLACPARQTEEKKKEKKPTQVETPKDATSYAAMAKKGKNKVQKEPKKKKKAKQAPKVSPTPVPREPAVLVYPEEDGPKTAEELKALLKQNIRPAELHVKVTSVRKLKNEGVAICVTKSEDIDTLKKAIEEAKGLKGKCGVKEPSTRNPHILIFDVDKEKTQKKLK
ncbi:uncharacterized protein LOC118198840 [Stegodyphus dumicola]|uniref:uncharacterized protein LOC118198840 n=1 Tax=Stegodyphus dumicola TaxID=202533 RepID=UPI0015AA42FB|nr:uncharacterized protein LOC118198840 [Stegodyphus dumicola]